MGSIADCQHAEKTLLHVARIPVRWGDMDSYGHVNNTLYIQYLEEARVAWFERLGIAMNNVSQGPVVLQTLHTCLKPVAHPATLVIELHAGPVGNSSLVVEHRLSTREDPPPFTAKAIASWSGSTSPQTDRLPCLMTCAWPWGLASGSNLAVIQGG